MLVELLHMATLNRTVIILTSPQHRFSVKLGTRPLYFCAFLPSLDLVEVLIPPEMSMDLVSVSTQMKETMVSPHITTTQDTDNHDADIVGNNIPVFFIQDPIQFPDLIHAVKPQADNEIPQAQNAHDTAYDFFSQNLRHCTR